MATKRRPGEVRDAILSVLSKKPEGASVAEIVSAVEVLIGKAARSSVRSYLGLNTPGIFERGDRGYYSLRKRSPAAKGSKS